MENRMRMWVDDNWTWGFTWLCLMRSNNKTLQKGRRLGIISFKKSGSELFHKTM